jgi:YebC/PmpR family DNA-binding regulatory protein
MSGHSKWATTKHKKAVIDAKRGKAFTKMAKLVTIAARDGKSGDPTMNPSLRMAIENAKAVSMPKENIDRAIKKGLGEGGGAAIEEVTYEAYGPFGVALLIECLTDNKNRTVGDIKAILNKYNGSLAGPGSVSYLFSKIGQIIIDESKNSLIGDELELAIIDSGADDFEKEDGLYVITCSFNSMHQVRKSLEDANITIESSEFIEQPGALIDLPEEKQASLISIIEKLEEIEDVSSVYANLNI